MRILASTVTLNNLTTQELLKRVEDMMREDWEFLKDFNAAVDQLQKKQFRSLLLAGSLGFKRAIVALLRQSNSAQSLEH